jgi:hypothetical protein
MIDFWPCFSGPGRLRTLEITVLGTVTCYQDSIYTWHQQTWIFSGVSKWNKVQTLRMLIRMVLRRQGTPSTLRFVLLYSTQSFFLAPFRRLWGSWFWTWDCCIAVGCRPVALTNWATTTQPIEPPQPQLSHHNPHWAPQPRMLLNLPGLFFIMQFHRVNKKTCLTFSLSMLTIVIKI